MLHEVSFVFRRNTFKHIKAIDRVIQFWQRFLNDVMDIERDLLTPSFANAFNVNFRSVINGNVFDLRQNQADAERIGAAELTDIVTSSQ